MIRNLVISILFVLISAFVISNNGTILEKFTGYFIKSKMILWTVTLLLLLVIYSIYTMHFSRKAYSLKKFPNTIKVPFLGAVHSLIGPKESIATKFGSFFQNYGQSFVLWVFHQSTIETADANYAQKVLGSNVYIEKASDYEQFHWFMGNGLVTSIGPVWRADRKLLSPSFKYQKYDGFLETFNKHSHTLVRILEEEHFKILKDNNNVKPINMHPIICRATMDFITDAALGQTGDYLKNKDNVMYIQMVKGLNIIRRCLITPWVRLPIIKHLTGIEKEKTDCASLFSERFNEAIKKRREVLASGDDGLKSGTRPFIDALLEHKTNEDIVAHISTIFGAGFETTASGINYTLYLLALNKECQDKVHEELDAVLDKDTFDLTFEDLAKLKYLEMCLKESMRIFPPVPVVSRNAHEDIQLDEDHIVPNGVDIVFHIYHLHRDPKVFPDPERFDPDRFLPSETASRHPYAYIPFSSGPRNCFGMKYAMIQMKTVLAHILRRFFVSTEQSREQMKVVYGLVLEPSPSIQLTLNHKKSQLNNTSN